MNQQPSGEKIASLEGNIEVVELKQLNPKLIVHKNDSNVSEIPVKQEGIKNEQVSLENTEEKKVQKRRGRPPGKTKKDVPVKVQKEEKKEKPATAITIAFLAKGIVSKEIRTNTDFKNVIQGHWEFVKGKKTNDLLQAIRASKVTNESEVTYDLKILKSNLKKLLVKA